MIAENAQGTATLDPPTTVNMDYAPQPSETATAATFPSYEIAVPFTDNTAATAATFPCYQMAVPFTDNTEGWNPAFMPPPPPYSEAGIQSAPVFMPQVIFKTDLSDNPGLAVCPACNKQCTTSIEYKSGCLTTLLCCLLFFFGCVLGCFLIPCCIKSCKDVNHYCPYCKHLIHRHKRL
ncbi:lipopolysaccharide-induced tumor necrosis factor-alpha factor homolog isoform X2 [Engystomops pustulosus]|uniref:lipopolysaccharide-induced tumor necrosis factor-alpha factor homolog isoform X2 n=1 Tax=Engystomops pustulosus TaxID=76066 RepID=UPI003AFA98BF